jgi:PAS domain S-box-containing protein
MKKQNKDLPDAALLRQNAEEQLKKLKVKANVVSSEAEMLKLIHELEVHQIELELQNEELVIAKEKAELAEEKYTALFDFAPSAYFNLSPNGTISGLNLAAAKMLGKDRRNLINNKLAYFLARESRDIFADFLGKLSKGESPQSCDVTFGTDDDSCIYAHLNGTLSGNRKQFLLNAVDITKRKNAEDALNESKNFTNAIANSTPALLYLYDLLLGKNIWTNDVHKKFFKDINKNTEILLYEDFVQLIHPDDLNSSIISLHEFEKNRTIPYFDVELRIKQNDGWKWMRHLVTVFKTDDHGRPLQILGALIDIDAQKKTSEELHRRNADLQLMNAINLATNSNESLTSIIDLIAKQFKVTFNSHLLSVFIPDEKRHEMKMYGNTLDNDLVQKIEKVTGKSIPQIVLRMDVENPFTAMEQSRKGLLSIGKKEITNRLAGYLKGTPWPVRVQGLVKKLLPVIYDIIGYQSSAAVPMISNGKIIGYLELGSRDIMTEGDLARIQSIADQFASVIIKFEAERNLRESEERMASAFNYAAIGMAFVSPDGRWLKVNPAIVEMLGYSEAELLSKTFQDITHPDDLQKDMDYIGQMLAGTIRTYQIEKRYYHKNGNIIWVMLSVSLVFDYDRRPLHFISQIQDITEQKESEAALKESEVKFRTLYETMAQGVVYQDNTGAIISANPAAERILGLSLDQMQGRTSIDPRWKSIHEDGSPFPGNIHPAMMALATGKENAALMGVFNPTKENYTWILVNSIPDFRIGDDNPFQVFTTANPDHDAADRIGDDNPFQVFTTFEDVTELKNAHDKISKANELLEINVQERTRELVEINAFQQAILDNAPIAILTTDTKGIIKSINPAGEAMTGYAADEVVDIMTPLSLHDRNEIFQFCAEKTGKPDPTEEEAYATAIEAMFHKTTEWHWVKKNGAKFPVKISHSSLAGPDGNIRGFMAMIMDVSREKEYLDSIRESEERFHKMFQKHAAVMLLINPENGEIIQANDTAVTFYGQDFNRSTINIRDINALSQSELNSVLEMAKKQQRNYFIFPHKLANGEIRTVEVHSTPIEVNGKKVLFSIIHDITERRLAEDALKKSEAVNLAIIQAVPDLMFRIHRDGTYLYIHSQNESLLYIPKEHFTGKKVSEVLPPDLASQSMQAIERAFTTAEVVQYEYMLAVREKNLYFENRMIAISDKEVLAIIRDITGRKTAEIELQDALRKLSTLIQNLQAGTIFESENRHITLVNQSFCNIFNLQATPEQLIGYDCLLASEQSKHLMKDPEGFIRQIDEILTKAEIVVNDELYMMDGRVLERDYIPIKSNDTLLGHFWQYRDITKRKASETALKMQIAAFESFALAIIITDIKGQIEWANSAFTKLTRYSVDEAIGKMPGELLKSGKQDKEFYRKFWDTILSKKVWSGEMINRRKDGSLYYEEQTITPVLDSLGNISNFIAIKIDITERKKLFQALADEKRRLADIIKGTNAGTWEWNIQTGETIFNDQWAQMLGYTLEDISPVSIETWMKFAHPDDLKVSNELLEKHFKGDLDYYSFESRMKHTNGEWIWVLDRGRVHEWDADGKPLLMSGTHMDITGQKRIEKVLQQAKNEAENANKAKSEFLSRMSHELRTPMNSILGFAQLMEMGELNPKQKKGVTNILNNGKHLLDLINEVLDIAGIEAGRQVLTKEPLQLAAIINEITDNIQIAANRRKISIEFVDSLDNSLFVSADRLRLKQILINLLNNAIKYNNEGGLVTIRTMLQPADEQSSSRVRISISDTGNGINPEDIGKLFQPFERIGADKTDTEGTGLGLMVVKRLTEAMNGTVGVESVVDAGSTFWIELPLTGGRQPEISQSTDSIKQEFDLTKQTGTILYIEDNLSNIELVEYILAEHRQKLRLITSMYGKQTVELAKEHKPLLILLDLDLPDISGLEVLGQLFADENTKNIQVIVISADAMPFQVEKLMSAGAIAYLTKPLDVVKFLKTIDQYIKIQTIRTTKN